MRFETTQMHFLSEVLVAVAVVVYAPYYNTELTC